MMCCSPCYATALSSTGFLRSVASVSVIHEVLVWLWWVGRCCRPLEVCRIGNRTSLARSPQWGEHGSFPGSFDPRGRRGPRPNVCWLGFDPLLPLSLTSSMFTKGHPLHPREKGPPPDPPRTVSCNPSEFDGSPSLPRREGAECVVLGYVTLSPSTCAYPNPRYPRSFPRACPPLVFFLHGPWRLDARFLPLVPVQFFASFPSAPPRLNPPRNPHPHEPYRSIVTGPGPPDLQQSIHRPRASPPRGDRTQQGSPLGEIRPRNGDLHRVRDPSPSTAPRTPVPNRHHVWVAGSSMGGTTPRETAQWKTLPPTASAHARPTSPARGTEDVPKHAASPGHLPDGGTRAGEHMGPVLAAEPAGLSSESPEGKGPQSEGSRRRCTGHPGHWNRKPTLLLLQRLLHGNPRALSARKRHRLRTMDRLLPTPLPEFRHRPALLRAPTRGL
eukprot:scaffold2843_cov465-Pavlova_lutheri.AAC.3